jgi:Nucleolar protein,Nop52
MLIKSMLKDSLVWLEKHQFLTEDVNYYLSVLREYPFDLTNQHRPDSIRFYIVEQLPALWKSHSYVEKECLLFFILFLFFAGCLATVYSIYTGDLCKSSLFRHAGKENSCQYNEAPPCS